MTASTLPPPALPRVQRTAWLAAVCLLCLAALALRWHDIARQSLWLDEGATVAFARLPFSDLLKATFSSEPNPPLYYGALHVWIKLAGTSEASLRVFSLLPGVLTVALVYRLGADLLARGAGLAAAALVTTSPYLLWLSQDARMYSLLGCASVALWMLAVRTGRQITIPRLLAFALMLLVTLYTHFFGVFSAVVAVLALLLSIDKAGLRRHWAGLLAAIVIPGVVYVPWLTAALRAGAAGVTWRRPVSLAQMLAALAQTFSGAMYLPGNLQDAVTHVAAALFVAGSLVCVWQAVRRSRTALLIPGGFILVIALVDVASRKSPIFDANYLVALAPLAYLAVGAALHWLTLGRTGLTALPLLPCVAAGWFGIQQLQINPNFQKEDFRTASAFLAARAGASDVVVLLAEYARLPFTYYYHGPSALDPFTGDPANPGAALTPVLQQASVAWLLLSHADQVDPKGQVKQWFDQRYPQVTQAYPRGIQLLGYRVRYVVAAVPPGATPKRVQYGADVVLIGYTAQTDIPPTDTVLHPPSNWLHVVLYVQALHAISVPYRSSVQLVDVKGVWGDELGRAPDALSLAANHWPAGAIVVEDADINLNPATPPGTYTIAAHLLNAAGQPLPVTSGDASLGTVHIVNP